jgi:hypothetical protein
MTLQIKKNVAPNLPAIPMNCDSGLCNKLNKFEISKFMNTHSTNLFCGKPGSGKTSLVTSMFKSKELFNKVFNNIYLVQPPHSRSSMKDDIFNSIDRKFDDLNVENLTTIMDEIKDEDPKYTNCIIFDDVTSALRDKAVIKLLRQLIFNRRHLRTSIFFLVQTYLSLEPQIRKLFSNLFIFKVARKELQKIFEEHFEHDDDLANPISKLVFDKPYNFLFINTNTGKMYKNWDEILIDE